MRLRQRREQADILNSPTARRTMRPGWEHTQFIIDPTNPTVAIAVIPS